VTFREIREFAAALLVGAFLLSCVVCFVMFVIALAGSIFRHGL
jgi:hypothetical protein